MDILAAPPGRVTATIRRSQGRLGRCDSWIYHSRCTIESGQQRRSLSFSMEGKVLGVNTARLHNYRQGTYYAVPYSTIEDDVADWKARLVVITQPSPTPPSGESPPSTGTTLGDAIPKGEVMVGSNGLETRVVKITENAWPQIRAYCVME